MGCTTELESATFGATIRCSSQLSYVHMVLPMGFEPTRYFYHQHLKLARLPISSQQHIQLVVGTGVEPVPPA